VIEGNLAGTCLLAGVKDTLKCTKYTQKLWKTVGNLLVLQLILQSGLNFELLKKCKEEFDIQDIDIWNFDKTGFQVGNLKGAAVFVPREIKKAFIRDPHNRELVTCVECVSAAGEAFPSFTIVKGASIQE
jgi:hypothetical protein